MNKEKLFADNKVGIYHPQDLDQSLKEIAKSNDNNEWGGLQQELDKTAYYVGYATHWNIQGNVESDSTPFQDFDKLHFPPEFHEKPLDILRFGCAGEMSLEIEMDYYKKTGITVKNHTTIDLSPIPLKRILLSGQIKTNPKIANATSLPFPDSSFDLLVTDQLLGSNSREKELALLKEIRRVAKPDSQIVMKVFAGLGTEGINKNKGFEWRENAINKFGEENGRDKYVGLTQYQWAKLGMHYANFVNSVYFNPNTSFSNFGEIEKLFNQAGFKIEESISYGNPNPVESKSTGDLIIRTSKI